MVAICGAPNVGKSTFFNRLTGLRQKVANYPGITVEKRIGSIELPDGQAVDLIDLPGIVGLHPRSEDERISMDVLRGTSKTLPKPSAAILLLDSTTLEAQLRLVPEILGFGVPTLVVLNMADDLAARGGSVDEAVIEKQVGAPVALVSARLGTGMERVRDFLQGTLSPPPPVQLPVLNNIPAERQWAGTVAREASYHPPEPSLWGRRLDTIFLHPVGGPLFFLAVVVAVFQSIFTLAVPMMDTVEALIATSGGWLGAVLPDSILKGLLLDGIWGGVGSVVIFLPQILILFLFVGILEDSGYLARAAAIADRSMRSVGLEGRSFIPLLSAYACAVPAIMAARTVENQRDRLATIFIAPLTTCSARLPVYALLIAAFIPERPILGPFLGTRATVLLGLYAVGFLAACLTAFALKSTVLKSKPMPFMLPLPAYRLPTLRSLSYRLLDRSKIFLRRAGTVIMVATIVLWFLASVPYSNGSPPDIGDSLAGSIGKTIEPLVEPLGLNWKVAIGLITSLAAREVIVGTLGTIYGMETDEDSPALQDALRKDLSFGSAIALLLYFAFAMQCMSTVAIVRRETGGWRWPIAQFAYMLILAYVSGLAAYRIFG
ncbi:MAG: ferrous iron transporter B [Bryobacterales bacterium]|nr:ferrous iron transporter B [Bryobacterales bacterium]MDE0625821.1 ferrous iron transporter B [Bryobacterales bacterium]